jgi:pyruvate,water dikinase
LRTLTTEVSQELFYTGRTTLLAEIGKRLGIEAEDLTMLSSEELKELLEKNIQPEISLIEERKEGYTLVIIDGQVNYLFGGRANFLHREVRNFLFFGLGTEGEETGKFEEIKGTTASPGKAIGRVKVLLDQRDISKLEKGNVLVATMTRPEYTVAMARASAFVTDEGGLTCHAAIIAREWGVPCIVGTKNATKVLKDGDEVEVDADEGIVRIRPSQD